MTTSTHNAQIELALAHLNQQEKPKSMTARCQAVIDANGLFTPY
jgi:hypothetical protein